LVGIFPNPFFFPKEQPFFQRLPFLHKF
jgi:hypothetical protein